MKSSSCQDTRLPSPLPAAVHTPLGQSHHQQHKLGLFSHTRNGNTMLQHGRREQRGMPPESPDCGQGGSVSHAQCINGPKKRLPSTWPCTSAQKSSGQAPDGWLIPTASHSKTTTKKP